jgi:hypothetical protein
MTTFEVAKALVQARSFGRCEGCGALDRLDTHHRMTRGSGGVHGAAAHASNDPRNLLALCGYCHNLTLHDAPACMRVGWVIERRSGVDPLEVPAFLNTVNGRGWWYLTEDGGYRWADELNLHEGYALTYQVDQDEQP